MIKILYYQIEGQTVRWIYQTELGYKHVVSCENYQGAIDFVRHSGGERLDNSINLYEFIAKQEGK